MGGKRGIVSRAEIAALIKEAHVHCRKAVALTSHTTPGGKRRLSRPRDQYLRCIGDYIQGKIKERARAMGYTVA